MIRPRAATFPVIDADEHIDHESALACVESRNCIVGLDMIAPDFDRIARIAKELEDMCARAKELRAELHAARQQGRFWRREICPSLQTQKPSSAIRRVPAS